MRKNHDLPDVDETEQPRRRAGLRRDEVDPDEVSHGGDRSAIGTPGGGTAAGGLAGTNLGDGSPDDAEELPDAMAHGTEDHGGDRDPRAEEPQAGRSGGAVGGTPTGKRSSPK